jgi:hypothetical protein
MKTHIEAHIGGGIKHQRVSCGTCITHIKGLRAISAHDIVAMQLEYRRIYDSTLIGLAAIVPGIVERGLLLFEFGGVLLYLQAIGGDSDGVEFNLTGFLCSAAIHVDDRGIAFGRVDLKVVYHRSIDPDRFSTIRYALCMSRISPQAGYAAKNKNDM